MVATLPVFLASQGVLGGRVQKVCFNNAQGYKSSRTQKTETEDTNMVTRFKMYACLTTSTVCAVMPGAISAKNGNRMRAA